MHDRFRMDNVPAVLRLPFLAYGYVLGFAWFGYLSLQRLSIDLRIHGLDHLSEDSNYIFCQWHESALLTLQACVPDLPAFLGRKPHAWLHHPSWYAKPIHVLLSLAGVERLVLGSTGHGGRAAADEVVELLRQGYSTALTPDGPGGPSRILKSGALHMALQSGVPVVPIRVSASRCVRFLGWDRKMQPLPFSGIDVTLGPPIVVTEETFEQAREDLIHALG